MLGFHVAEAFSNNPESNQAAYTGINCHVVNVAKAQFRAWCHSFRQYTDNGTVRLDMFSGEAVALCYELQLQASLRNKLHLHHSHRPILLTCQISVASLSLCTFSRRASICGHYGGCLERAGYGYAASIRERGTMTVPHAYNLETSRVHRP